MGRYVRVVLSLAVLAVLYHQIGGFETHSPSDPAPEPTELPAAVEESTPVETSLVTPESTPPAPTPDPVVDVDTETVTIGRGESFYVALQRAGLDHETIMGVVNAAKPHTNLRRVSRGDEFDLGRDHQGNFASLRWDLDAEHFLQIFLDDSGMDAEIGTYPVERVVKGVRGTIESSLFEALRDQGADPQLAGQLADILGWDIDFFRDLRKGDTFTVLYEEFLHEGQRVRDGQILAAHFTNRGERHEAYLFENDLELPAYFDDEGNSLEKQFLRAPLKFSRVSSGFTKRRLHPVLKTYRPHYGVDYAAPTGTPVLATADGIVTERTSSRGSGNFVGLRHGQTYESFYLHLSRFAKGVRVGDKVKQGDVIGYVGQTGWATGPHLDYRVKVNGRWTDPRKLKLPPAEPVPGERRADFERVRDKYLTELMGVPGGPTVVVEEVPGPALVTPTE